ncbi:MAG: hypothetical protein LBL35_01900 [Clostridiales bacterium]|nr:hypothetical protein [Clostridiales bacterium]
MSAPDWAETLRYLGYSGQDISPDLEARIRAAMDECAGIAAPRKVWREFGYSENGEVLGASLVLPGDDIKRRLKGCERVVIMAATLGVSVDAAISRYETTDLSYCVLLDAAATSMIEAACDEMEAEISARAGAFLGERYSPGYGDMPIEIQPRVLAALEAGKKIGLMCTPSFIMTPRKSVTAILGVSKNKRPRGDKCSNCSMRDACRSSCLRVSASC